MILPGIQALLGFQTIAVFNQRFQDLSTAAQYTHLLSLVCIIMSIVLVMTPAALYRISSHRAVTQNLLKITSLLLGFGMFSLSLALCLDSYVVATLVFNSSTACFLFAALVLCLCWIAWFLFPFLRKTSAMSGGDGDM